MSQAIEHRMRIEPGTWVSTQGRRVCIVQVLDLETVVVQDAEKGEAWHAKIDNLWPEDSILEPPTETVFSELSEIEEKDWEKARERLELFSLCWMIWTVPVRRWRHDLLRTGERVPMQQALPHQPYFVFLSRAEERPLTDVWPIALSDPLPSVPVPLLAGDADVWLDLQAAFTAAYALPGYDWIVDYSQPPDVPLTPEEAVWAEAHLRH